MGLVADKSNNHAVEVEEEHQQVETQFDERFLGKCQLAESRYDDKSWFNGAK